MTGVAGADAGLERLVSSLTRLHLGRIDLVLVLGSGLGVLADRFVDARKIAYDQIEGWPVSRVPGHAGELILGTLNGVRAAALKGRVHLYEGHPANVVTRAVRAFTHLGARALLLTNAAGGVRKEWNAGTLMCIRDHLLMQGTTGLARDEAGRGNPYDPRLAAALADAAKDLGIALESGVYAALPGPSYETPAEIRMLRSLGADAVGMSTALEALAACVHGAKVAAVSLITNPGAGITGARLTHEEVVAAGRAAAGRFADLIAGAAPRLLRAASSGPALDS